MSRELIRLGDILRRMSRMSKKDKEAALAEARLLSDKLGINLGDYNSPNFGIPK